MTNATKKIIALIVLICFAGTQTVTANPGAGIEIATHYETPSFLQIDIPAELATLDGLYEAPPRPDPKLILHIQNAHANYAAQMKIKELLQYLHKTYAFKTIFVEGASEDLNPEYLKMFPDKERNTRLADFLAKQGELTGAELFILSENEDEKSENADPRQQTQDNNSKTGSGLPSQDSNLKPKAEAVRGVGIENAALYRENYEALEKVFGAEKTVTRYLGGYETRLDGLASKVFTPELRKLLGDWKKFEKGHREFMPYVHAMVTEARKILAIDLESLLAQVEWPQITRLLQLQVMEKDLKTENALAEKDKLIQFLTSKKVSPELLAAIQGFQGQRVSVLRGRSDTAPAGLEPRSLMEKLVMEAGPKGFRFQDYPEFSTYAGYLILKNELDPKGLFQEIQEVFTQMLDTLAKTPRQKELLAIYRDEELVRKLLNLELPRKEWQEAVAKKNELGMDAMVERLKAVGVAVSKEANLPLSNFETKKLSEKFRGEVLGIQTAAYAFYDAAHKREDVFYQKIEDVMTRDAVSKAVLVTGGFHTDGITDLLREHQISYGILTPRLLEKSDEKLYRSVMLQNKQSTFELSYLESVSRLIKFADQEEQLGKKQVLQYLKPVLRAIGYAGKFGSLTAAIEFFNASRYAEDANIQIIADPIRKDEIGRPVYRVVRRTAPKTEAGVAIAPAATPAATVVAADQAQRQSAPKARSDAREMTEREKQYIASLDAYLTELDRDTTGDVYMPEKLKLPLITKEFTPSSPEFFEALFGRIPVVLSRNALNSDRQNALEWILGVIMQKGGADKVLDCLVQSLKTKKSPWEYRHVVMAVAGAIGSQVSNAEGETGHLEPIDFVTTPGKFFADIKIAGLDPETSLLLGQLMLLLNKNSPAKWDRVMNQLWDHYGAYTQNELVRIASEPMPQDEIAIQSALTKVALLTLFARQKILERIAPFTSEAYNERFVRLGNVMDRSEEINNVESRLYYNVDWVRKNLPTLGAAIALYAHEFCHFTVDVDGPGEEFVADVFAMALLERLGLSDELLISVVGYHEQYEKVQRNPEETEVHALARHQLMSYHKIFEKRLDKPGIFLPWGALAEIIAGEIFRKKSVGVAQFGPKKMPFKEFLLWFSMAASRQGILYDTIDAVVKKYFPGFTVNSVLQAWDSQFGQSGTALPTARSDARVKPAGTQIPIAATVASSQTEAITSASQKLFLELSRNPKTTLYRGTTLSQWDAIRRGETPQSEYSTGNRTWATLTPESAIGYARQWEAEADPAVVIVYKTSAEKKVRPLTDYPGDDRRQGKLSIDDVAKVYDLDGNLRYDADKGFKIWFDLGKALPGTWRQKLAAEYGLYAVLSGVGALLTVLISPALLSQMTSTPVYFGLLMVKALAWNWTVFAFIAAWELLEAAIPKTFTEKFVKGNWFYGIAAGSIYALLAAVSWKFQPEAPFVYANLAWFLGLNYLKIKLNLDSVGEGHKQGLPSWFTPAMVGSLWATAVVMVWMAVAPFMVSEKASSMAPENVSSIREVISTVDQNAPPAAVSSALPASALQQYQALQLRVPLLENMTFEDYQAAAGKIDREKLGASSGFPEAIVNAYNATSGVVIIPVGVFPDDVPGTIDLETKVVFVNAFYIENGPGAEREKRIRLIDVGAHEGAHLNGYPFMRNGVYDFDLHVADEINVYEATTLGLYDLFPEAFSAGRMEEVRAMVEGAKSKENINARNKITGNSIARAEVRAQSGAELLVGKHAARSESPIIKIQKGFYGLLLGSSRFMKNGIQGLEAAAKAGSIDEFIPRLKEIAVTEEPFFQSRAIKTLGAAAVRSDAATLALKEITLELIAGGKAEAAGWAVDALMQALLVGNASAAAALEAIFSSGGLSYEAYAAKISEAARSGNEAAALLATYIKKDRESKIPKDPYELEIESLPQDVKPLIEALLAGKVQEGERESMIRKLVSSGPVERWVELVSEKYIALKNAQQRSTEAKYAAQSARLDAVEDLLIDALIVVADTSAREQSGTDSLKAAIELCASWPVTRKLFTRLAALAADQNADHGVTIQAIFGVLDTLNPERTNSVALWPLVYERFSKIPVAARNSASFVDSAVKFMAPRFDADYFLNPLRSELPPIQRQIFEEALAANGARAIVPLRQAYLSDKRESEPVLMQGAPKESFLKVLSKISALREFSDEDRDILLELLVSHYEDFQDGDKPEIHKALVGLGYDRQKNYKRGLYEALCSYAVNYAAERGIDRLIASERKAILQLFMQNPDSLPRRDFGVPFRIAMMEAPEGKLGMPEKDQRASLLTHFAQRFGIPLVDLYGMKTAQDFERISSPQAEFIGLLKDLPLSQIVLIREFMRSYPFYFTFEQLDAVFGQEDLGPEQGGVKLTYWSPSSGISLADARSRLHEIMIEAYEGKGGGDIMPEEELLLPGSRAILAMSGDKIIGFIHYKNAWAHDYAPGSSGLISEVFLNEMAVNPQGDGISPRPKGVGTRLLDAAVRNLASFGMKKMKFNISENSRSAHPFYYGFVKKYNENKSPEDKYTLKEGQTQYGFPSTLTFPASMVAAAERKESEALARLLSSPGNALRQDLPKARSEARVRKPVAVESQTKLAVTPDEAAILEQVKRDVSRKTSTVAQEVRAQMFESSAMPNRWNQMMSPVITVALSLLAIGIELFWVSGFSFFDKASFLGQAAVAAGLASVTILTYTILMNLILGALYQTGKHTLYRGLYGTSDTIIRKLTVGDKASGLTDAEIEKGTGVVASWLHLFGIRNRAIRSATLLKNWAEHYTIFSGYAEEVSSGGFPGRIFREITSRRSMARKAEGQRYRIAGSPEDVRKTLEGLRAKGKIEGSVGLLEYIKPTGRGTKAGNVRLLSWNPWHFEVAIQGEVPVEQMFFVEVFLDKASNAHLGLRTESLSVEGENYEAVLDSKDQILSINRTQPSWRAGALVPDRGDYKVIATLMSEKLTSGLVRSDMRAIKTPSGTETIARASADRGFANKIMVRGTLEVRAEDLTNAEKLLEGHQVTADEEAWAREATESHRILSPEHPLSRELQGYLNVMASLGYPAGKIMIAVDGEKPVAGALGHHWIIVNMALLRRLRSVDELAAILAHEQNHIEDDFRERKNKLPTQDNLIEKLFTPRKGEIKSDLRTPTRLQKLGFKTGALGDALRSIAGAKSFSGYVHPDVSDRIIMVAGEHKVFDFEVAVTQPHEHSGKPIPVKWVTSEDRRSLEEKFFAKSAGAEFREAVDGLSPHMLKLWIARLQDMDSYEMKDWIKKRKINQIVKRLPSIMGYSGEPAGARALRTLLFFGLGEDLFRGQLSLHALVHISSALRHELIIFLRQKNISALIEQDAVLSKSSDRGYKVARDVVELIRNDPLVALPVLGLLANISENRAERSLRHFIESSFGKWGQGGAIQWERGYSRYVSRLILKSIFSSLRILAPVWKLIQFVRVVRFRDRAGLIERGIPSGAYKSGNPFHPLYKLFLPKGWKEWAIPIVKERSFQKNIASDSEVKMDEKTGLDNRLQKFAAHYLSFLNDFIVSEPSETRERFLLDFFQDPQIKPFLDAAGMEGRLYLIGKVSILRFGSKSDVFESFLALPWMQELQRQVVQTMRQSDRGKWGETYGQVVKGVFYYSWKPQSLSRQLYSGRSEAEAAWMAPVNQVYQELFAEVLGRLESQSSSGEVIDDFIWLSQAMPDDPRSRELMRSWATVLVERLSKPDLKRFLSVLLDAKLLTPEMLDHISDKRIKTWQDYLFFENTPVEIFETVGERSRSGAVGVFFLDHVSSMTSSKRFGALFKSGFSSETDDSALKLLMVPYWISFLKTKVADGLVLENRGGVLYAKGPGIGAFSTFDEFMEDVYALSPALKLLILKKLLVSPNGLLHNAKQRHLFAETIKAQLPQGEGLDSLIRDILDASVVEAEPEELFLMLARSILPMFLNRPKTPADVSVDSLNRAYNKELKDHDNPGEDLRTLLRMPKQAMAEGSAARMKAQINTMLGAAAEKLGFPLAAGESKGSEEPKIKMDAVEIILNAARSLGATGIRFLQVLGQYMKLSVEQSDRFRTVYDENPGQNSYVAWRTLSIAAKINPKVDAFLREHDISLDTVLGRGSLFTTFLVHYLKQDGTLRRMVLKVRNPNVKGELIRVTALLQKIVDRLEANAWGWRVFLSRVIRWSVERAVRMTRNAGPGAKVFGGFARGVIDRLRKIESKVNSNYQIARMMLKNILAWNRGDLEDREFPLIDPVYHLGHNNYPASNGVVVKIPSSEDFPNGEDVRAEELVEGETLKHRFEGKYVAAVAEHFCRSLLRPLARLSGGDLVYVVHSDLHVGNVMVSPDGAVHIIDRNFYLKFSEKEMTLLRRMLSGERNAKLLEAMIDVMLETKENVKRLEGVSIVKLKERLFDSIAAGLELAAGDPLSYFNVISQAMAAEALSVPLSNEIFLKELISIEGMLSRAKLEPLQVQLKNAEKLMASEIGVPLTDKVLPVLPVSADLEGETLEVGAKRPVSRAEARVVTPLALGTAPLSSQRELSNLRNFVRARLSQAESPSTVNQAMATHFSDGSKFQCPNPVILASQIFHILGYAENLVAQADSGVEVVPDVAMTKGQEELGRKLAEFIEQDYFDEDTLASSQWTRSKGLKLLNDLRSAVLEYRNKQKGADFKGDIADFGEMYLEGVEVPIYGAAVTAPPILKALGGLNEKRVPASALSQLMVRFNMVAYLVFVENFGTDWTAAERGARAELPAGEETDAIIAMLKALHDSEQSPTSIHATMNLLNSLVKEYISWQSDPEQWLPTIDVTSPQVGESFDARARAEMRTIEPAKLTAEEEARGTAVFEAVSGVAKEFNPEYPKESAHSTVTLEILEVIARKNGFELTPDKAMLDAILKAVGLTRGTLARSGFVVSGDRWDSPYKPPFISSGALVARVLKGEIVFDVDRDGFISRSDARAIFAKDFKPGLTSELVEALNLELNRTGDQKMVISGVQPSSEALPFFQTTDGKIYQFVWATPFTAETTPTAEFHMPRGTTLKLSMKFSEAVEHNGRSYVLYEAMDFPSEKPVVMPKHVETSGRWKTGELRAAAPVSRDPQTALRVILERFEALPHESIVADLQAAADTSRWSELREYIWSLDRAGLNQIESAARDIAVRMIAGPVFRVMCQGLELPSVDREDYNRRIEEVYKLGLLAHGAKNLDSISGILQDGNIAASNPERGGRVDIGPLAKPEQGADPSQYASTHGPNFVIVKLGTPLGMENIGEEYHAAYLVPNDDTKKFLVEVLDVLVTHGKIDQTTADRRKAKIKTLQEFNDASPVKYYWGSDAAWRAPALERIRQMRDGGKFDVNDLPSRGQLGRALKAINILNQYGFKDFILVGSPVRRLFTGEVDEDASSPEGEVDVIMNSTEDALRLMAMKNADTTSIPGVVILDGIIFDVLAVTRRSKVDTRWRDSESVNWAAYTAHSIGLKFDGLSDQLTVVDPRGGVADAVETKTLRWANPQKQVLLPMDVLRLIGFHYSAERSGLTPDKESYEEGKRDALAALTGAKNRMSPLRGDYEHYLFVKALARGIRDIQNAEQGKGNVFFSKVRLVLRLLVELLRSRIGYFMSLWREAGWLAALSKLPFILEFQSPFNKSARDFYSQILKRRIDAAALRQTAFVFAANWTPSIQYPDKHRAKEDRRDLPLGRELGYLVYYAGENADRARALADLWDAGGYWIFGTFGMLRTDEKGVMSKDLSIQAVLDDFAATVARSDMRILQTLKEKLLPSKPAAAKPAPIAVGPKAADPMKAVADQYPASKLLSSEQYRVEYSKDGMWPNGNPRYDLLDADGNVIGKQLTSESRTAYRRIGSDGKPLRSIIKIHIVGSDIEDLAWEAKLLMLVKHKLEGFPELLKVGVLDEGRGNWIEMRAELDAVDLVTWVNRGADPADVLSALVLATEILNDFHNFTPPEGGGFVYSDIKPDNMGISIIKGIVYLFDVGSVTHVKNDGTFGRRGRGATLGFLPTDSTGNFSRAWVHTQAADIFASVMGDIDLIHLMINQYPEMNQRQRDALVALKTELLNEIFEEYPQGEIAELRVSEAYANAGVDPKRRDEYKVKAPSDMPQLATIAEKLRKVSEELTEISRTTSEAQTFTTSTPEGEMPGTVEANKTMTGALSKDKTEGSLNASRFKAAEILRFFLRRFKDDMNQALTFFSGFVELEEKGALIDSNVDVLNGMRASIGSVLEDLELYRDRNADAYYLLSYIPLFADPKDPINEGLTMSHAKTRGNEAQYQAALQDPSRFFSPAQLNEAFRPELLQFLEAVEKAAQALQSEIARMQEGVAAPQAGGGESSVRQVSWDELRRKVGSLKHAVDITCDALKLMSGVPDIHERFQKISKALLPESEVPVAAVAGVVTRAEVVKSPAIPGLLPPVKTPYGLKSMEEQARARDASRTGQRAEVQEKSPIQRSESRTELKTVASVIKLKSENGTEAGFKIIDGSLSSSKVRKAVVIDGEDKGKIVWMKFDDEDSASREAEVLRLIGEHDLANFVRGRTFTDGNGYTVNVIDDVDGSNMYDLVTAISGDHEKYFLENFQFFAQKLLVVAKALQEFHKKTGMQHGDVNYRNILIEKVAGAPYLIDFAEGGGNDVTGLMYVLLFLVLKGQYFSKDFTESQKAGLDQGSDYLSGSTEIVNAKKAIQLLYGNSDYIPDELNNMLLTLSASSTKPYANINDFVKDLERVLAAMQFSVRAEAQPAAIQRSDARQAEFVAALVNNNPGIQTVLGNVVQNMMFYGKESAFLLPVSGADVKNYETGNAGGVTAPYDTDDPTIAAHWHSHPTNFGTVSDMTLSDGDVSGRTKGTMAVVWGTSQTGFFVTITDLSKIDVKKYHTLRNAASTYAYLKEQDAVRFYKLEGALPLQYEEGKCQFRMTPVGMEFATQQCEKMSEQIDEIGAAFKERLQRQVEMDAFEKFKTQDAAVIQRELKKQDILARTLASEDAHLKVTGGMPSLIVLRFSAAARIKGLQRALEVSSARSVSAAAGDTSKIQRSDMRVQEDAAKELEAKDQLAFAENIAKEMAKQKDREQAAELERQMKTAEKSVAAAPAEGTKEMTVDALLALVPEKDHASLMAKVSEVRKFVGAGVSDAVIIVALLVGGILDLNKSKTTMAEAARQMTLLAVAIGENATVALKAAFAKTFPNSNLPASDDPGLVIDILRKEMPLGAKIRAIKAMLALNSRQYFAWVIRDGIDVSNDVAEIVAWGQRNNVDVAHRLIVKAANGSKISLRAAVAGVSGGIRKDKISSFVVTGTSDDLSQLNADVMLANLIDWDNVPEHLVGAGMAVLTAGAQEMVRAGKFSEKTNKIIKANGKRFAFDLKELEAVSASLGAEMQGLMSLAQAA